MYNNVVISRLKLLKGLLDNKKYDSLNQEILSFIKYVSIVEKGELEKRFKTILEKELGKNGI